MDCKFSSVDVMRFLDEYGEKFLMAVSKTPGIKKAVLEFRSGKRDAITKYEMRSNDGTTFRFWPVIKKRLKETKGKRRWEYLMHATNVERQYIKRTMKDVPEEYKKRWSIDNSFKSVEQIRARTGSQNHSIRVFMFFLSFYDRVQPVVYGSAKNKQGVKDQVWAACQKKKIWQLMYFWCYSLYWSRGS